MFGSLAIARTQSTKPRIRTMSFSMSKASLPVFEISLNALSAILDKAEAHAAAKKIDPSVLLHSRLSPDMFALVRQVQIATDLAKNGSARLAGAPTKIMRQRPNSTGLLPQRTHCYVRRPVDLPTRRRALGMLWRSFVADLVILLPETH